MTIFSGSNFFAVLRGEHLYPLFQLFHHCELPNQFCHLLRDVETISRDVQRPICPWWVHGEEKWFIAILSSQWAPYVHERNCSLIHALHASRAFHAELSWWEPVSEWKQEKGPPPPKTYSHHSPNWRRAFQSSSSWEHAWHNDDDRGGVSGDQHEFFQPCDSRENGWGGAEQLWRGWQQK